MSQAWVLLWLATDPANAAQSQMLLAWADHNHIALVDPVSPTNGISSQTNGASSTTSDRPPPYAGETVAHIETLLERARLAADGLDTEAALELIAQVQQDLREHPELPQAAWLLAESLRVEADLVRAGGDPRAAESLERDAERLEGTRSRAASAHQPLTTTDSADANPALEDDSPRPREWLVNGLRPGDQLVWNGAPAETPSNQGPWHVETIPGRHHARVLRSGAPLWAAWVDLTAGAPVVDLPVPPPLPCSQEDLAPMHTPGLQGVPVRCDRWIAARPIRRTTIGLAASPYAIEVARCHRDQCGAFERWPPNVVPAASPPSPPDDSPFLGAPWWSYAVLGTVVAATATVFLLGVTQRREEERAVWVYGGVK